MRDRSALLIRLATACIALMLLFGACSGDDDDAGPGTVDTEGTEGTDGAATIEDAVAFISSPVMSDFWSNSTFENPICKSVEPPSIADVQQQWDCTVDNDALVYRVAIDPEGRMFVRYGLTPTSGRTITNELVVEDLRNDHGYNVEVGGCSARAYTDATIEYACESELVDGSGPITYRVIIADAALGPDSPFEVLDVIGPEQ